MTKKRRNNLKKSILFLILILLVLGGVYAQKNLFSTQVAKIPAIETPEIIENSEIKTAEKTSWEKYQGFGFTFEYPVSWKVDEINSWTDHEYNIFDPASKYEKDYKGLSKSYFYSRSWNIMVFSEKERRNYLDNDKLLSPSEYAKFYCETVNSTGRLRAISSPQNGKNAYQATCFTVTDEYLIYNDHFFATVSFRAYGGTEVEDGQISRFLSEFKILD